MLAKITDKVWQERKQAAQDLQDMGKSIMELLLRAERPGAANTLGPQEIAAEVSSQLTPTRNAFPNIDPKMMTLIFAGYETTATVIAWALHELALNPAHQDALRNELSALGSEPVFDKLHSNFPFLDAVINETLRVHPVVTQVHREASKDSLVPLTPLPQSCHKQPGGVTPVRSTHLFIPRGTIVMFPVNVMQSAEDVWGPDAHAWDPRRWADIEGTKAQDQWSDWRREILVFSTGCVPILVPGYHIQKHFDLFLWTSPGRVDALAADLP